MERKSKVMGRLAYEDGEPVMKLTMTNMKTGQTGELTMRVEEVDEFGRQLAEGYHFLLRAKEAIAEDPNIGPLMATITLLSEATGLDPSEIYGKLNACREAGRDPIEAIREFEVLASKRGHELVHVENLPGGMPLRLKVDPSSEN